MDCSSLRDGLDKHLAYHATFALAPLIPTFQRAFGILDLDSMGPLLKNAIMGLSDVYAKFLPKEKELLKILHCSTAVVSYAILWKTDTVPVKSLLEKGKSALATLEPLVGSDLEEQKTGVDCLLKLYSELEIFSDTTAKLAKQSRSAALMWQAFRAGQELRESLVTLGGRILHVLTMMDDFEAGSSYMSIHLGANLLDPAIQQLSSAYKGLHGNIRDTVATGRLQPNNIPGRIKMLQDSVLMATGVSEQKKVVDPSMEQIETDMKLIELDNEQDEPNKKQDEDWEAV